MPIGNYSDEVMAQAARIRQEKLNKEARQAEVDKGEEDETKKALREQGRRRFRQKQREGKSGDFGAGSLGDTFSSVLGK